MESLSYVFEDRAFLFKDDTDFQVDGMQRSKSMLHKWDLDPLSVETMDFVEPVHFLEISGDDTNVQSGKSAQSTSTVTLSSLTELGIRFSSSVSKPNGEKTAATRETNGNRFSVENSVLSSPEPAKRARITRMESPFPTCQVLGCNKDLSSSKDYHKRHRVCDVHSKTAVVVVNGIQQRFCQQCSRFHILAEFDKGKRSCRKRLAGHNERRRKPQFDTHLGSSYFTTDASLMFSRILPGGLFNLQCNEFMKVYPSRSSLDTPLSVPELSVGSNTSCALSLLSAQSQSLLSNSAGKLMAHPLISRGTTQDSAKLFGKRTSLNFTPSTCDSLQEGIPFEATRNEVSLESNALNLNSYSSPEGVNTVNLLELSLRLQKVERQKAYGQVKLENGVFCHSSVT